MKGAWFQSMMCPFGLTVEPLDLFPAPLFLPACRTGSGPMAFQWFVPINTKSCKNFMLETIHARLLGMHSREETIHASKLAKFATVVSRWWWWWWQWWWCGNIATVISTLKSTKVVKPSCEAYLHFSPCFLCGGKTGSGYPRLAAACFI